MTPEQETYTLNLNRNQLVPWMELALQQARQAYAEDEIPVGAVLVDARGSLLAAAHNQPLGLNDPSAHAEILALSRAGLIKKNYRLPGTILITTLEPCLMCAGALIQARIAGLIFASRDPKAGCIVSRMNIFDNFPWLNHRFWIQEGILAEESRELLRRFFAARRKEK